MKLDPSDLFSEHLVDLGQADPDLRGILAPQSEIGTVKVGVTSQFLENAADYHEAYKSFGYFRMLIDRALAKFAISLKPDAILDIGSGSGNSVIPLLERFPDAFVVATDISPQLLAILRDHLESDPVYGGRYALVCMDASNDHYIPERFDLAVGAAILHHIIEPGRVIRACASALRPGGLALFFEPFEIGHMLLKLAYIDIIAESGRRAERAPAIETLEWIVEDLTVRLSDKSDPLFLELDDKWLFTRSFFETATQGGRWESLEIHPINSEISPLTDQTRLNLRQHLGSDENALPDWAWQRLKNYEQAFSRHARRDMLFEGMVMLRRGGGPVAVSVGGEPELETELRLGKSTSAPLSGWWWNPGESGSGWFLSEQDGQLTVVSCIYGEAGEAQWHVAGPAPLNMGEAWNATYAQHDPAGPRAHAAIGDNDAPSLQLVSSTSIELHWGARNIELQRQYQTPLHPRTGLWKEDGNGSRVAMAIECLPDSVFAALLMPDGWCITLAAARDGSTYVGDWSRYSGGQTRNGPWRKPEAETVGKAQIAWVDKDCVVVLLPDTRRVALTRHTAANNMT